MLKRIQDVQEKKKLRLAYSKAQLAALNIEINIENKDKLPFEGQYLLLSNHRTVIDPLIIEVALEYTKLFGLWIAKKELYSSPFFGLFVRNAGSILIDREKSQMSGFFADVKAEVQKGDSVFIFPEGTRNTTDKSVTAFKEGSRLIALKNKLPILPVYIKDNAREILKEALYDNSQKRKITLVIGDIIDYKDKANLALTYKERFGIA
ncbi:MAG TPA: 1-acyl-sn-glycerol-3-phosphate acyltransferase [Sulfurovum sp. UBA12169]|nr:MAG TPA: 1-acyl-sn-glycerol-3-phosphate acyltransferase [Sulfurovum sp. UBA12169]